MSEHRRGPIRSEAARSSILKATAQHIANRGYQSLTMEGIAAEAKVGKQTIYRWWPTKGAVVADCLIEGLIFPHSFSPPDTGDLRADLESWMTGILDFIENQGGDGLVRSLIAAAVETPEVGDRLNESLGARTMLLARLSAAVKQGDLAANAPLEEMGEALVGAVVMKALGRTPQAPDAARRVVSAVLGPLPA